MKIKINIRKIEFNNNKSFYIEKDSIILIIGANNSGKSTALKDILNYIRYGIGGLVINSAIINKETSIQEIKQLLEPFIYDKREIRVTGHTFHISTIDNWWGETSIAIGDFLTERSVSDLFTQNRLVDCHPQPNFERREPFSEKHPFQNFYKDDSLELRASALFRRAFKKDLVIHRGASANIPAYVGERPIPQEGEDRISSSYLDRLETLDRLESQGDGMRSFASILGRILADEKPILLIDEPEAFLHPPQARIISSIIAKESIGRQVFVATHSSDVLQGILGEQPQRVEVIRLSRTSQGGDAVRLSSNDVAELWKDPILRFSKILDGLFHEAVVITEADADCRFYEALTQAITPSDQLPDIHYTYSGGKDRLPTVIRALKKLGVPVVSIADFDLLNNDTPLANIVEAHDGEWSEIKPIWEAVKKDVEQTANFIGADQFKTELAAIIKTITPGSAVPKPALSKIRKLTRNASPWDRAKRSGLASLDNGASNQNAKALLKKLGDLGIFVVPNGEIEGFCREVSGHGPRWVEEVTKRNLSSDPELADARRFVASIITHLNLNLTQAIEPPLPVSS